MSSSWFSVFLEMAGSESRSGRKTGESYHPRNDSGGSLSVSLRFFERNPPVFFGLSLSGRDNGLV